MEQLCCRREVMHVRGCGLHRMDQSACRIHPDMDFHPVVPLIALLGLVHLWIPLALLVFRGGWGGNQGGINDRSLLHCHALGLEMGLHGVKNPLAQFVLLQQVPKRQDRRLIRDPLPDPVDPSKTSHDRYLDQGILHGWIAQRVPLLHQVDPEHGGQRIGRTATFGARLGVVGLNQICQRLPGHHLIHLREKSLTFRLLFGRALLVIPKSQLLGTHQSSPGLRSEAYSPVKWAGFPDSP